jgi:hypothetical protein
MISTLAKPPAEARTLPNGCLVRMRFTQSAAWTAVAGVLGACLIAGLYYLVLEQHWYIHAGSFNHGSSLKAWWDNGMGWIKSGAWFLYRHGLRDIGEPAAATMAVRTLLAKAKYWDVRVSTLRLVTAPLVLLAITLGMTLGGIWVLDFGGPAAWAHIFSGIGHPGYRLNLGWLGKISAGNLALGFIIGQVLHHFWAPVGATLQGFILDRAVDRAEAHDRVPLWVRLPLSPPVIRERFASMYRRTGSVEQPGGTHRLALTVAVFIITAVTIVGAIAKFWIAHGHGFPYLAS